MPYINVLNVEREKEYKCSRIVNIVMGDSLSVSSKSIILIKDGGV